MAALIPVAMNAGGFVLKHWTWFAVAGLVIALGIDHARLNHAKADQIDPATHAKWKDEYRQAAKDLALARTNLDTCRGNVTTLSGALDHQSAAVTAVAEAGRQATAASEAAVRDNRRLAATAVENARRLALPPAGATACERAQSTDDTFVRTLP